jgi:hypothetical protein
MGDASNATLDCRMRRQLSVSRLGVLAIFVLALTIVVTIAIVVGGRGRDEFGGGSVSELTKALHGKGLAVCSSSGPDSGRKGGAASTQVLHVALPSGCADPIDLQVDAYRDAAHRDAAARSAEGEDRQRHFGVVFTWHRYTLYLQSDDASTSTPLRDRVIDALDSVAAR